MNHTIQYHLQLKVQKSACQFTKLNLIQTEMILSSVTSICFLQ